MFHGLHKVSGCDALERKEAGLRAARTCVAKVGGELGSELRGQGGGASVFRCGQARGCVLAVRLIRRHAEM
jgi:hypothetical protein